MKDNPSPDLFSGIIRLISDDFNDADGKLRSKFYQDFQEDGEIGIQHSKNCAISLTN